MTGETDPPTVKPDTRGTIEKITDRLKVLEQRIETAAGAEPVAERLGKMGRALEGLAANIFPKIGALEKRVAAFEETLDEAALEEAAEQAAERGRADADKPGSVVRILGNHSHRMNKIERMIEGRSAVSAERGAAIMARLDAQGVILNPLPDRIANLGGAREALRAEAWAEIKRLESSANAAKENTLRELEDLDKRLKALGGLLRTHGDWLQRDETRLDKHDQTLAIEKPLLPAALKDLEVSLGHRMGQIALASDDKHDLLQSQFEALVLPLTGGHIPTPTSIREFSKLAVEQLAALHKMHENLDLHPDKRRPDILLEVGQQLLAERELAVAKFGTILDKFRSRIDRMAELIGGDTEEVLADLAVAEDRAEKEPQKAPTDEEVVDWMEKTMEEGKRVGIGPHRPFGGIPPERIARIKRLLREALAGVGRLTPFKPTGAAALDDIQNPLQAALDLVVAKSAPRPAEPRS